MKTQSFFCHSVREKGFTISLQNFIVNERSLVFEGVYRIRVGGLVGLKAGAEPGDKKREQAGQHKEYPVEADAGREVLEPSVHDEKGNRPGY